MTALHLQAVYDSYPVILYPGFSGTFAVQICYTWTEAMPPAGLAFAKSWVRRFQSNPLRNQGFRL